MEEAEKILREHIKKAQFDVVYKFDVAKKLKDELDRDIIPYVVLGVNRASYDFSLVDAEPECGLLLPCNILL